MGALLRRATSEEALLHAWTQVRENAYADGEPSAAVSAFEHRALSNLTRIAASFADGSYSPRPMTRITIPKPTGGVRRLAVGPVEDRIVERAILGVLDPMIDPLLSPWSFAYRRGLGVTDAIRALTAARDEGAFWVARTDIDECFESIPRWEVLQRLAEIVPDAQLVTLVGQLVGRLVMGEDHVGGTGLHQGGGLSPLLSNLYLDRFDRQMIKLGLQVIRYGDDIAIPVTDRPHGERVLELAAAEATSIKLRLELTKSHVASFDDGVRFCGQVVTSTSGSTADPQSRPLEGTVFVATEGALLRTKGERLRVEHDGELLANVNFKRIRQIVCIGRVGVTSTLLHRVVERGVDLAWLFDDGRFAGRLTTLAGGDPELRIAQYRVATDGNRALRIARQVVAGKITNMRVGLLRAARTQLHAELADGQSRLAAARTNALTASSIPELMGYEGAATRDYFTGFGAILGADWEFVTRQRRPPPDPVNSMLSFGYTLLTNEAVSACVLAGLDPYLGMLHSPHRNRPSLALDLMEELRPVVVDAMIVRLTRTNQITQANFTITPEHGCRLDDVGRRAFLSAYERRMLTLSYHPIEGRRVSWRNILYIQAKLIATALVDGDTRYQPVVWR